MGFNKMSDEQLAAYIDGQLSAEEKLLIEHTMGIDTFEVLSVSEKALKCFSTGGTVISWKDISTQTSQTYYAAASVDSDEDSTNNINK